MQSVTYRVGTNTNVENRLAHHRLSGIVGLGMGATMLEFDSATVSMSCQPRGPKTGTSALRLTAMDNHGTSQTTALATGGDADQV